MAKQNSVFKYFGTDKDAEKGGVWTSYGDIKFLMARAGGSNIAFAEALKNRIAPVRHQVDRGTLSIEEDLLIQAQAYADAVIKDVQVLKEDGTWERGLPSEDGNVVPFSKAALISLLTDLPDLFRDLRAQAGDTQKYLKSQDDADLGNSKQS